VDENEIGKFEVLGDDMFEQLEVLSACEYQYNEED
jgi:hypothetical protein